MSLGFIVGRGRIGEMEGQKREQMTRINLLVWVWDSAGGFMCELCITREYRGGC
jgi:hypothetical protein